MASTAQTNVHSSHRPRLRACAPAWLPLALLPVASIVAGAAAPAPLPQQVQVPATLQDFFVPGTQPTTLNDPIQESQNCSTCHGYFDEASEPYRRWAASMMGQAGRDPIFYATLTIANQDVDFGGELCLRCHAPGAWLDGRSTPTNGSALDPNLGDLDGVTCHFCHRLVDPVPSAANPADDGPILAALNPPGLEGAHSGSYIIDPNDVRRGPFDLGQFFYHQWRQSPFHRESLLCATCHDVSNPLLERQPNGSWQLGPLNAAHPTAEKLDMFPVERTYSEWANSVFAQAEIDMGGRFGGDKPTVASCQDCHMPDLSGGMGCNPGLSPPARPDLPQHNFSGANSWVLRAVRALYPDYETGLSQAAVDDSIARNEAMLRAASDLEAIERNGKLLVRVTNMGGHKLPTGYGEGRRMWINVRFYNGANLVAERGRYNQNSATLSTQDTTVFSIDHGLDAQMAAATGLTPGKSFHFLLNNTTEKDNRIPARGYRAAAYEAVGAYVVGTSYADEQYWSETEFDLPVGATRAEVRLFHQTTSKEYVTFLRDENVTDDKGLTAYRLWEAFGKSEPVQMGLASLDFASPACLAPRPLALGKARANGVRPELTAQGDSSRSNAAFAFAFTGGEPGQLAVLFEGQGQLSIDLAGGVFNAGPATRRVATFNLDANGAATIPVDLTTQPAGTALTYQVVFRDPQDPLGLGLSGGLRIDVCE
ncbi:MAG: multiheme c-type cytochrome [Planctomycetota bacterium]